MDESTLHRMPPYISQYVITQQNKPYVPCFARILWMRDEHPAWSISTHLIEGGQAAGLATMRAEISNEAGHIIATGHKTETLKDFPGGWVEKAETGAVSRALANAGYGTQFAEELPVTQKRAKGTAAPSTTAEVWPGPGKCPGCNAPAGKPHTKTCKPAPHKPTADADGVIIDDKPTAAPSAVAPAPLTVAQARILNPGDRIKAQNGQVFEVLAAGGNSATIKSVSTGREYRTADMAKLAQYTLIVDPFADDVPAEAAA